jgi:hypothetical protein
MSALELLERATEQNQHAASREMAKRIYAYAMELVNEGHDPQVIYAALDELYHRHRVDGKSIQRDALVEVLDAFEDLYPPEAIRETA